MTKAVLGIDFGTTNTAAAWVDARGELQIVPVREDSNVLPSVVCFHGGGAPLVGHAAREFIVEDPQNTIFGVKRFLGRRYLSDFVGRNRGRFMFRLVEGEDGMTAVEIKGQTIPLEDVAFHILNRIVELANIAAGEPFEECVLSVPAHYTFRQRQVIRKVAERLLHVKSMINEPTAAALYFAKSTTKMEKVLIYDLGGGTFDATLLHIHDGLVEVLATGGDAFLGGHDFDLRLVESLLESFEHAEGIDLHGDMIVAQRLQFAAERAKIKLSTDEQTSLRVPCVAMRDDRFVDLASNLTRGDLETVCAPLVERTIGICEQILARAHVTPADLGEVVLVGGMTRMPYLRNRIGQVLPLKDSLRLDPEVAVAVGAAIHAKGAQNLIDVISVPIGVMAPGMGPEEAVRQSTPLPALRRVKLARPPEGKPLNMIFFEAVDVTSIDRDILGNAQVPASWLAENKGDLALEVRMSASFELSIFMHASEGGRLPIDVTENRPGAPKPAAAPSAPGTVARTEERVPVQVRVAVRVPGHAAVLCDAENLSRTGVFVRTSQPLARGARVDVEIDLHGRMLRTAAEVMRTIDGDTAQVTAQTAGMGLRFDGLAGPDVEALDRYLVLIGAPTNLAAGVASSEPAKKDAPRTIKDALEPIQRFLTAVSQNNLYDGLGVAPLASDAEVRAKLDALRAQLEAVKAQAPAPVKQRLVTADNVLNRVTTILIDPRRRLDYDFKLGHVFAHERLQGADQDRVAMLREAWARVNAQHVEKSNMHLAHAMRAAREGQIDVAVGEGETALSLDPFNTSLMRLLADWRGMR